MSSKCRLLAVDIDGTLLDGRGKLTPRVRQALHEADAAGMKIVLATGRRFRSSLPVVNELGVCSFLIAQHGTIIKRIADAKTVWLAPLRRPTAARLVRIFETFGLEPLVFTDSYEIGTDFWVVPGPPSRPGTAEFCGVHHTAWKSSTFGRLPAGKPVVEVGAFDNVDKLRVCADEVRRLYGGRLNYHVIKSPNYSFYCVEAISRRAGKGNALLALAHRLGIRKSETAAIGDDVNDVDMLSKAGTGIAMGNAADAIKKSAHFVVGPNTADGLADAVRMLLSR